jgi:RNA polymerase-binding transcription factor DksA
MATTKNGGGGSRAAVDTHDTQIGDDDPGEAAGRPLDGEDVRPADAPPLVNPDNAISAHTPPPAPAGEQVSRRTDLDFGLFRKRLMEEKELAEATIRGTRSSEEDGTGAIGMEQNELSSYDNHPADVGTETFLREQDQALIANAREILGKIDRALQKLDEGSYGICDKTHKPIPVARLEAIPYATLTVEAQEIQEVT